MDGVQAGFVSNTVLYASQLNDAFAQAASVNDLQALQEEVASIGTGGGSGSGFNVTADGDNASGSTLANVAPNGTLTLTTGNNIAITQNGANLTIGATAAISATSVTVVGSQVSLGASGLNNGGQTLTNVAAGNITSSTSTDAVNGGQLYTANVAVNAAQTAASNALALAGTASTAAANALSVANGVSGTASSALSVANTASTTASTALSTANTASNEVGTLSNSVTALGNTVSAAGNTVTTLGTSVATGLGGGASYNSTTGEISAPIYYINFGGTSTGVFEDVGSALSAVSGASIPNVSMALLEILGNFEIDLSPLANHSASELIIQATLEENTSVSFSNPPSEGILGLVVIMLNTGNGGSTVTWPSNVRWPGGVAPTITSAASKTDTFVIYTIDGGQNFFGFVAGQNQ